MDTDSSLEGDGEVSYIAAIHEAYKDEIDDDFADLVSLEDEHCLSANQLLSSENLNRLENELSQPLSELVSLHLQVLEHTLNKDFDKALSAQCTFAQTFAREFQKQNDENWGMKVLETICKDLRRIALTAESVEDPLIRSEENTPTCMERAADIVMGLFRVCAGDSRVQEPETRRWGMLMLVNQLFKIYFRINRLQLCKPLIRAIESQPIRDKFPVHQMVTYKYYVGRKAMFDSEFREAEACLTFAFENSSPYPTSPNKRKVLIYLVPVKMFLGYLPTEEALTKYDISEFMEVALAIRFGNVRDFDAALQKHEKMFITNGVYFILEKLRMLLFRNLFKKVCLLHDSNQIPINWFVTALNWSGYAEADGDEVQCLLSNLIYDGQIRGYISHQHQVLVVAKTNPFPKISACGGSSGGD